MSIKNRISRDELRAEYSNYGWFLACPVYLSDIEGEAPLVVERNWIPEWWFTLNEATFGAFACFASVMFDWEPVFPILVGPEID